MPKSGFDHYYEDSGLPFEIRDFAKKIWDAATAAIKEPEPSTLTELELMRSRFEQHYSIPASIIYWEDRNCYVWRHDIRAEAPVLQDQWRAYQYGAINASKVQYQGKVREIGEFIEQINVLSAALKPFADCCDRINPLMNTAEDNAYDCILKVKHFHRAKAAIVEAEKLK